MKRSTFVFLLTFLVCGLVFTLCMLYVKAARVEPTEYTQTEYGMERFVLYGTNYGEFYVLVDRDTGVEYLAKSNGGICPLYEADGSPMLVGEANRPEVSE